MIFSLIFHVNDFVLKFKEILFLLVVFLKPNSYSILDIAGVPVPKVKPVNSALRHSSSVRYAIVGNYIMHIFRHI